MAQTQAQQIAALYDNDGQVWEDAEGVVLQDALREAGAYPTQPSPSGLQRWELPDGSAIITGESHWDHGLPSTDEHDRSECVCCTDDGEACVGDADTCECQCHVRQTPAERTGARIHTIRGARGLSQSQLARAAGLHQEQIARAERGRHETTLPTLRAIACGLGVDVALLVQDIEAHKDAADRFELCGCTVLADEENNERSLVFAADGETLIGEIRGDKDALFFPVERWRADVER